MHGSLLYHERQDAALCGVHTLNTLLQGPYFTAVELSQIAQELDDIERKFMQESGVESDDYVKYLAEGSGNVSTDGFFSIQVLSRALDVFGLSCQNLDGSECTESAAHPEKENAFICNLREHWFALRRVAGDWWDLNSLFPCPRPLSEFYLSAYLATLRDQGYSIFLVQGQLPGPFPDPVAAQEAPGAWFTPEQARAASEDATNARQLGYLKAASKGAMANASESGTMVTLRPRGSDSHAQAWDTGASEEDEDLSRAIAASLAQNGANTGSSAPEAMEAAAPSASLQSAAAPAAAATTNAGLTREDAERCTPPPAALPAPADPGPEPEAGPGVMDLAIRLPHGERLLRKFRAAQPVTDVLAFARSRCPGLGPNAALATQMPRRLLRDMQQSLRDAGVTNRETLTVTC